MIYGIEEDDSLPKTNSIDLFKETGVEISDSDVIKAFRVGLKVEGKNRPIKATVRSKELRDSIVWESRKLKDKKWILPDRSQEERKRVKELVEESKKRNGSEDENMRPKNGMKWAVVGKLRPTLVEIEIKKKLQLNPLPAETVNPETME